MVMAVKQQDSKGRDWGRSMRENGHNRVGIKQEQGTDGRVSVKWDDG